ncbi:MAG: CsgG/HfaB family protein [Paraglaciecola sp.]|uniref:Curli production assembly/transport component CsgG n=1 Tax=Alishewanella maricola TaxID=2795740 RepID=A0ABS8C2M1_9ALTE|nr:CsgG/HfaB family protein [Alishewanella maricola]MCB5226438.1 CsgG/HfaB family protein [Alishewanella maricola]MDP5132371.1 CsgG/HfaB family protein [Paraglaciecola sp.]
MQKIIIPLALLTLTACTSATREVVNQPTTTKPVVSATLSQQQNMSLKRVIAIARFSDETKRGNAFLIDQNADRLGKQASDILSARLTDTQKFIMLERSDLDKVQQEQSMSGTTVQNIGSDYLIVGSVSEFGRSTNSEVGVFSRNLVQTATATVNVRLINTRTGQVIYSEEATGEARVEANTVLGVGERAAYDTAINDKALSAAISKLVSNITENLLDAPWQAYLVSQQGSNFLMTGGKSQGIKLNDTFSVEVLSEPIRNPQTGMLITLPGEEVATLKVIGFIGSGDNELSICQVVSGSLADKEIQKLIVKEQGKV